MRGSLEFHAGKEKLEELIKSFPADHVRWTEATNRFQFIDELLTSCLGWTKPDIRVEESDDNGGRSDYILGNPAKGILEAKKPALLWEDLPQGAANRTRSIETLCASSPAFKAAVTQVIPYCALKGAALAAVCNGTQLAIFQGVTVGNEPLKGHCFFFDGVESYLKDFQLLWTILSPEGVTENRALNELSKQRAIRLPPKVSNFLTEPLGYRYRNHLQEELRNLGSMLLEEIEDNPALRAQFYRECYVPLEANNRHLNLSKQIIERRYERLAQDASQPRSLHSSGALSGLPDTVFINAGSKPIVVIGDVGVGKTSFFENLALTVDPNNVKLFLIHIDLGTKATLSASIKEYVLEAIPVLLRRRYDIDIEDADFVESVYDKELKRFDNSIYGKLKKTDNTTYQKERLKFIATKVSKPSSHILASLAHISHGRGRRVVLIIDNADQRTFEDQQSAFLIAQEMASTRSMYVFVSLRPSTFFLSKTTGALSAYQNKILTISPPPADIVIEKRLGFALRVAEGKVSPGGLNGIRVNLPSIVSFLKATLRSVRSNNEIKKFLSNITGGNTRAVIELITTFCGSPNVDARKIVNIESESNNYHIPLHEFTKHALLGEYVHFNPQSSLVACNVYDVFNADPREHFLRQLLVAFLSAPETIRNKDGFCSGIDIESELIRHGFANHQTASALRILAQKKLIETPFSHFKELETYDGPSGFNFRATSVGLYHLRQWAYSFSFLDAVSTDTPIFDDATREKISRLAESLEIRERAVRAGAFKEYLLQQWFAAGFEASYFDLPAMMETQRDSFDKVARVTGGMKGFRR